MGFFKKEGFAEDNKYNTGSLFTTETVAPGEDNKNVKEAERRKNLTLFNAKDIEYIIDNFPSMSDEIRNSLNNLSSTLEKTIDYIEDRSSEIIKDNRDFKLSQSYRDTSIAVYDVVKNLKDYTGWMKDRYDKNIENKNNPEEINKKIDEGFIEKIESMENNKKNIYEDMSFIEPKGFDIKGECVKTDSWDDLLVKTAEILNKEYKEYKKSTILLEKFEIEGKKSSQNSFRDTVIDMLNEYKIPLNEYKILY